MPFQSTLAPLGNFLIKYTPSNSIRSISFPSSTRPQEFVKFLVTLKILRSHLIYIHLQGKHINGTTLAALENLLGKWTETLILENPCPKTEVMSIVSLIAAAPHLKSFAIQTCGKVSEAEYDAFLRNLYRAGETGRLHHRHPEMNARLRCLHISCSQTQSVKFSVLADLGKFFPCLEMLRIENWRICPEKEKISNPIYTLRGLSLVGIDFVGVYLSERRTGEFVKMLSRFIACFPGLEYLFIGAKQTPNVWGWNILTPPKLSNLFNGMELTKLKVLWLRGWTIDCVDILSLKTNALQYVVIEECKGVNGGWIKGVMSKWKRANVIESDTRFKNGVDFGEWRVDLQKSKIE